MASAAGLASGENLLSVQTQRLLTVSSHDGRGEGTQRMPRGMCRKVP